VHQFYLRGGSACNLSRLVEQTVRQIHHRGWVPARCTSWPGSRPDVSCPVISGEVRTLRAQGSLPLSSTFRWMASIQSCPTIAKATRWKENFMSAERAPNKVLLRGEQSGGRGLGDRERLAARLRRATSSPPRLRRDLLPHRGRADLSTRRRAVHEDGWGAGLRPAGGWRTLTPTSPTPPPGT
jgi:hypothetical protein